MDKPFLFSGAVANLPLHTLGCLEYTLWESELYRCVNPVWCGLVVTPTSPQDAKVSFSQHGNSDESCFQVWYSTLFTHFPFWNKLLSHWYIWFNLSLQDTVFTVSACLYVLAGGQAVARGFRILLRFFILACQKWPKKGIQKIPYSQSKFYSVCWNWARQAFQMGQGISQYFAYGILKFSWVLHWVVTGR